MCLHGLMVERVRTLRELLKLVLRDLDSRLRLREQRHDSLSRMPTDDRNDSLARILRTRQLSHEGFSTHDVEGGDAEEFLGVEFAGLGQDFGGDGDRAIDRVADDEDVGFGAVFGDAFDQALHDAGVDLEEIVAGHAWFACGIMSLSDLVLTKAVILLADGCTHVEYRLG